MEGELKMAENSWMELITKNIGELKFSVDTIREQSVSNHLELSKEISNVKLELSKELLNVKVEVGKGLGDLQLNVMNQLINTSDSILAKTDVKVSETNNQVDGVRKDVYSVKRDVLTLKVKSAVWGTIAALIMTAIINILVQFFILKFENTKVTPVIQKQEKEQVTEKK